MSRRADPGSCSFAEAADPNGRRRRRRNASRFPGLAAAALLVHFASGCDSPPEDADADPPAPDPFAGLPADGPPPEIGPAPPNYVPTAANAPSTDIWIGRAVVAAHGMDIAGLFNATDRAGYDNQPSFSPDGTALYFVRAVDSTQTDVLRYVLATSATERVTRTSESSEFSPTFIPGQEAFSVIRETRGRQHLWRYGADGRDMGAIFATVEPVGYHAWAGARTAVMFVLGDPPSLWTGDALGGAARAVADHPGRSIHRIPGTESVSFVRKPPDGDWWIERLDPASGETRPIVRTLPGREDHAWTPSGLILMADGPALYAWSPEPGGWNLVAGLPDGGGDISRIAVSPDGQWVALVAEGT